MIRGSTGRLLTLVLAPLLVVAVTAIVMLPRSGGDKVEVNADGPAVTIESPQTNSRFNRNTIQVVARISDPDGLATAELRVQDKRVATSSLSGSSEELTSFNWEASEVGEYQVAVRARVLNGSWGEPDEITISIEPDSVDLPPPPTTIISNVGIVDTTPTTVPGTDTTVAPGTEVAGGATSSTLLPPLFPSRTSPPYSPGTFGSPGTIGGTQPPVTPSPSPVPEPGTLPPTLPPTLPTTLPPTTIPPCIVGTPMISSPRNGATEVPLGPTIAWTLVAPCAPRAQELQVLAPSTNVWNQPVKPVRARIALDGSARSYTLPSILPACTNVTISVLSYDESPAPGFHRSTSKTFTTSSAGCVLPPTTTTTSTTTTTTLPPPTDPPPTDPPATDPATSIP